MAPPQAQERQRVRGARLGHSRSRPRQAWCRGRVVSAGAPSELPRTLSDSRLPSRPRLNCTLVAVTQWGSGWVLGLVVTPLSGAWPPGMVSGQFPRPSG